MKKRMIAAWLLAAALLGCAACGSGDPSQGDPSQGDPSQSDPSQSDPSPNESDSDTVAITDATTDPATDSSVSDTDADTAGESETDGGDLPALDAHLTELSVLGTVAGTGTGNAIAQESVLPFSTDSTVYSLKEADAEGTTVTLRGNTVSALRLSTAFNDGTVAKYQAKIQHTTIEKDSNWCSLFIGLRLADETKDPTSQSGIWIALQSNEIGIRTNNWAETTLLPIQPEGVDFSTARMLYIEDDMASDTVTLRVENDAGDTVELATVKLEDGMIHFYQPGETSPAISDPILGSINPTGATSLWLHHTDNTATISDFTASGSCAEAYTAADANLMAGRDILSDTWVSIDDVGRLAEVGNGTVGDKKVGIFYFLWHNGTSTQPIYDHAKAYAEGGSALLIETMTSGPLGFAHYWAEPYFGYYQADDEWVIRKHTYQLNAAGVDFIFIDATNGHTYEHNYETILKVWSEMRAEGHETPQIMFHCGNNDSLAQSSFTALWNNLYSQGRYEDLWFKWEGKPLILMPHSLYNTLTAEQQAFFSYRQSWAFTEGSWYTSTRGKGAWAWADMYPQRAGYSHDGDLEQMIVMCGFWANGSSGTNAGRSYSYRNGGQPAPATDSDFSFSLVDKTSGLGLAFEEQFEFAIKKDPGLIMITGWNEWWAGRWEAGAAVGQTVANTYTVTDDNAWTRHYFVDCFNPEYSRDIEPVKGYFNDNYYYQMVQNIRQYKGSRALQAAFGQKVIDLAGDITQWDAVGPEYRDYTGDVTHRDHMSYVGQIHYTNDTGRNDFTVAKVSRADGSVYFYAECADDITAPEGTNWMNLYINADADLTTGWYGYEYLINRTRDGETCSIQKFVDGEWKFEDVGSAAYVVSGKTIQIKVDAAALGLGDSFDFKWADNSVDSGDIMQFLDLGDTAPDGRFNYRYTTVETETVLPEVMTDDLVVLKAGSYYAYVGGELVRLDESTTKATFFGDAEHLYLPLAFVRDTLGLSVDGCETYNHYGVLYIDAKDILEGCGKTVSMSDNLVVLGDRALTADEMLTMYRAMY